MASFRVPYPEDPERRKAAFLKVEAAIKEHGTLEGTPEKGTIRGSTPFGEFVGSYHCPPGSGEMVVDVAKKPWLVSHAQIESEVRRFLNGA